MKMPFLFAAAVVAAAPMHADAHGPTRQKVAETVSLAAPPAKVWERVKNFGDMSWLPPVFSTEAPDGNKIGSVRTLTLGAADGPKVIEELTKYSDADRTYSYKINEVDVNVLPVTNYSSHVTVRDGADGGSVVEWRGAFYRGFPNNDPPENLNDAAAVAAVTGVYRAGLDALKAEFGPGK